MTRSNILCSSSAVHSSSTGSSKYLGVVGVGGSTAVDEAEEVRDTGRQPIALSTEYSDAEEEEDEDVRRYMSTPGSVNDAISDALRTEMSAADVE